MWYGLLSALMRLPEDGDTCAVRTGCAASGLVAAVASAPRSAKVIA